MPGGGRRWRGRWRRRCRRRWRQSRWRWRRWGATLAGLALAVPAAGAGCAEPDPPPVAPWPGGSAPSWQWQLTGALDLAVEAEVFALDAFDTTVEEVRRLRERNRRLLCYVRVGVYEADRPDAARYPAAALGRPAGVSGPADPAGAADPTGPAGGRWLDVRQWSALEPILADRFRLCRGKGFQAVFPDHMDGYAHRSGFPLTFDDQLVFNRRIAELARRTGLSPGLTNDLDQALALERDFDFAVNEECFRRRECERLLPFVTAGKPVFQVEYTDHPDPGGPADPAGAGPTPGAVIGSGGPPADVCTAALGYGFAAIRKRRALDAWRDACIP